MIRLEREKEVVSSVSGEQGDKAGGEQGDKVGDGWGDSTGRRGIMEVLLQT